MSNLNQTIAPRICGDVSVPACGGSAGYAVRERGLAGAQHLAAMPATAQKFTQISQGTQAWSPPT